MTSCGLCWIGQGILHGNIARGIHHGGVPPGLFSSNLSNSQKRNQCGRLLAPNVAGDFSHEAHEKICTMVGGANSEFAHVAASAGPGARPSGVEWPPWRGGQVAGDSRQQFFALNLFQKVASSCTSCTFFVAWAENVLNDNACSTLKFPKLSATAPSICPINPAFRSPSPASYLTKLPSKNFVGAFELLHDNHQHQVCDHVVRWQLPHWCSEIQIGYLTFVFKLSPASKDVSNVFFGAVES